MILNVKTKSGAHYRLNRKGMTWERGGTSPTKTRTDGGTLLEWPEVVLLMPMRLVCPPLHRGDVRYITTTHVVAVSEEEG